MFVPGQFGCGWRNEHNPTDRCHCNFRTTMNPHCPSCCLAIWLYSLPPFSHSPILLGDVISLIALKTSNTCFPFLTLQLTLVPILLRKLLWPERNCPKLSPHLLAYQHLYPQSPPSSYSCLSHPSTWVLGHILSCPLKDITAATLSFSPMPPIYSLFQWINPISIQTCY